MGCSCSKPQPTATYAGPAAASPSVHDIRNYYRIGSILGSGSFGQVRVCVKKDTNEVYAVKIMSKDPPKEKRGTKNVDFVLMFRNEVRILNSLNHPNVVKIYEHFEDKSFLYVVMSNCGGGELFSHIVKRRRFPEAEAAVLCKQMLDAIQYIHSVGVIHRDIKAENFLFKTARVSSSPELVLIDFGMSTRVITPDHTLKQLCGSPHYVAPELIRRNYLFKVDMWALGVIVFLMLYGKYPFEGADQKSIVDAVLYSQPDYSRGNPPSDLAIEFMKSLLEKDPSLRLSPYQAQNHEWILQQGRQCTPISSPSHQNNSSVRGSESDPEDPLRHPPSAATQQQQQHSQCPLHATAEFHPNLAGSCHFEDVEVTDCPVDAKARHGALHAANEGARSSTTISYLESLPAAVIPADVTSSTWSFRAPAVTAVAAPPAQNPKAPLRRERGGVLGAEPIDSVTISSLTATTTTATTTSAASGVGAALPIRPMGTHRVVQRSAGPPASGAMPPINA